MVERLKARQQLTDAKIERAMRVVPRHSFGHWLSLETVYGRGAHPLPGATAATMSTISDPAAVAIMLEPLRLQPGQRVLEIGAGTGSRGA
jgi:protein-L-isoaspartate(D-aspartate) O-methyltransferase